MTKELLIRDVAEPAVCFDFSDGAPLKTLADEASEILHYKVLAQKATEAVEDVRGTLRKILDELDIVPYTADSVRAYQTERLDEVNREALAEFLKQPNAHNNSYYANDWRLTKIEEYTLPIPEFVLNKAVQIKRAMPDVNILIEHLTKDPFLVVQTSHENPAYRNCDALFSERFYIEVWEEPKFEGRL